MGELLVSGPTSAMMYWNNREQSRHTFLGEWTRSGDKYVEDEDGYFVYCGRRDDMLKVSGMYVSPFEVEGALATHPDVLEAAVVAWPDGDGLIKPKAFVVLKDQTKVADAPARDADVAGAAGPRQNQARPLQIPALDRVSRRPAEDRDRQDPALQIAQRGRGALSLPPVSHPEGFPVMKRFLLAGCAVAALAAIAAAPAVAQQKTIKIGFISSFSGPVAAIGNDMRNSFELALDHLGRKIGGMPVEVIYEDDQIKPEVGVQKTQKLIESDKVDFMVGYIWSNVALASLKPLVDSKTITFITNAGASQIAGELCSPYVFSTSWNNDQTPQAVGLYMNQKNVKTAFLIGPNYAAGKDMLEGVAATFKGQIVGRELTAWPNQLDFSAELSKARAAKPDAIFAFYPGGAGIQFVTQYAQSGLKGQIPLYTAFTIDELSMPRLKDLAVGIPGRAAVGQRSAERRRTRSTSPTTRPSTSPSPSFYGAQTYDAAMLLDSALKATKGDMSNKDELRKAIEKADFKSVRGNFKFGPNHIPIQNFYLQDVVKEGDDYRLKTVATIVENDQDKHVGKCKMPN